MRSDAGIEMHNSDAATIGYGSSDDDRMSSGALSIVCETEMSPLCPYGWAYYADADGSEGTDSCVYISPSTVTSWSAANSSCPDGSHLLTVKSASNTSGLLPFATSLYHGSGQYVYIGCRCVDQLLMSCGIMLKHSHGVLFPCSQSGGASQRATGWSWVDDTSAANLNCGSGTGGDGCGLWNGGEPK